MCVFVVHNTIVTCKLSRNVFFCFLSTHYLSFLYILVCRPWQGPGQAPTPASLPTEFPSKGALRSFQYYVSLFVYYLQYYPHVVNISQCEMHGRNPFFFIYDYYCIFLAMTYSQRHFFCFLISGLATTLVSFYRNIFLFY